MARMKRLFGRIVNNDYLFTILTKIFAVVIGLIASSYSNRFLGPQLKGELGRISSLLSVVAVTANFGLYQPYPYYKRQQIPDVLDRFLRIFALQFLIYMGIGITSSLYTDSFAIMVVCLLAPIQVLANQLSFMIMVEDVKFKNVIFFTARITNTVITILAFYTMKRTILVSLALVVVGDVITIVLALIRLGRLPNPFRAGGKDYSLWFRQYDYDAHADAQLSCGYPDDGLCVPCAGCGNRVLYPWRVHFRIRVADSGCVP